MKVIALDTEITTWNKGNPFDPRNFMVCYSWASDTTSGANKWPNPHHLQSLVNDANVIATFLLTNSLQAAKSYCVHFHKQSFDQFQGQSFQDLHMLIHL